MRRTRLRKTLPFGGITCVIAAGLLFGVNFAQTSLEQGFDEFEVSHALEISPADSAENVDTAQIASETVDDITNLEVIPEAEYQPIVKAVEKNAVNILQKDQEIQGVTARQDGSIVVYMRSNSAQNSPNNDAELAITELNKTLNRPVKYVKMTKDISTSIGDDENDYDVENYADAGVIQPMVSSGNANGKNFIGGAPWAPGVSGSDNSSRCSMGFPGYDSSGKHVILTAGHCTNGGAKTNMNGVMPSGEFASTGNSSFGALISGAGGMATLDAWVFGYFEQPAWSGGAELDIPVGCNYNAQSSPCFSDVAAYTAANSASDWQYFPAVTKWSQGANNLVSNSLTISSARSATIGQAVYRSGRSSGFQSGRTIEKGIYGVSDSACTAQGTPLDACNFYHYVSAVGACVVAKAGDSGGSLIQSNADGTYSAVGTLTGGGANPDCNSSSNGDFAVAVDVIDGLKFFKDYFNKTYLIQVAPPTVSSSYVDTSLSSSTVSGKAVANATVSVKPVSGNFTEFTVTADQAGNWNFNYNLKMSGASQFKLSQQSTKEKSENSDTINLTLTQCASRPNQKVLNAGQCMSKGEVIDMGDTISTLAFQGDGNLVLYTSGKPVFYTSTSGTSSTYLIMQGDGNLVMYDAQGRATWNSRTSGFGNSRFSMQTDANLVIYRMSNGSATWNSGTSHPAVFPSGNASLLNNVTLSSGGQIVSPNRFYRLVMQGDGNLVLYKYTGAVLWNSRTSGHSGARLVNQADGNLVIYSPSNHALWNSGTSGKGIGTLSMQGDGNLVRYNNSGVAPWNTGTSGR